MLNTDLIAGPYIAPALKRGDRAFCIYRDCDVIVTTWTDARISWPRCRALGSGAGSGLLVNEELARAIKTESAVALKHWFGVGTHAVWEWRKAFGIGKTGTSGSHRLHRRTAEIVRARLKGVPQNLTPEGRKARSNQKRKEALARIAAGQLINGEMRPWTAREVELLGKAPDAEVAQLIERSRRAVRHKRMLEGIPSIQHRPWTAKEDKLVLRLRPVVAAFRLRRTLVAVYARRRKLMRRDCESADCATAFGRISATLGDPR
jgi:hypothetical protein